MAKHGLNMTDADFYRQMGSPEQAMGSVADASIMPPDQYFLAVYGVPEYDYYADGPFPPLEHWAENLARKTRYELGQ